MARPYSRDLRERVVRAVERGLSRRKAAAVFELAASTVVEWVRVWRESGSLSPKPMGGDHNSRLKDERDWLLGRIAAASRLTAGGHPGRHEGPRSPSSLCTVSAVGR